MVILVFLGLVVWLSSALWVGMNAESTGRNPWAWFGVTLVFGIFSLLVYWATNPPRDGEKYDGGLSFSAFAGYMGVIFSTIIGGFLIGVILARLVGGLDDGSIQAHAVYEAISSSGMFIIIITGLFGNLYRRYSSKRTEASRKTTEVLSWYEPRIIGILILPLAIHTLSMAQKAVFMSVHPLQPLVGILLILISLSLIIADIWSLGIGKPLNELQPFVNQLLN
ncbi:hypothetical protein PNQ29_11670 [Halobacterium salinarum]|uniref:hypothetical protein n=1 Tax=Halobacterium salinarum TaxID=2242 RepID=UPI002554DFAF|nr:hypothetical protein [Halobacterium salinarum]MDL0120377.1 hypothetical protein [Halobacterium salinarum]